MKKRAIPLILLSIAILGGALFAWNWRNALATTYFYSRVAKASTSLPRCNRVEVFYLGSLPAETSDFKLRENSRGFPIRPYGDSAKILDTKTLTGKDAEALALPEV